MSPNFNSNFNSSFNPAVNWTVNSPIANPAAYAQPFAQFTSPLSASFIRTPIAGFGATPFAFNTSHSAPYAPIQSAFGAPVSTPFSPAFNPPIGAFSPFNTPFATNQYAFGTGAPITGFGATPGFWNAFPNSHSINPATAATFANFTPSFSPAYSPLYNQQGYFNTPYNQPQYSQYNPNQSAESTPGGAIGQAA
jgi:hypothetical protein